MAHIKPGDAVLTGVGLGLGLAISSYAFQAMRYPRTATREVIVCLNCRSKNPLQNKHCWQCGKPLYPLPTIQCAKCKAKVPSMAYCGNCGAKLRRTKQKEKKSARG